MNEDELKQSVKDILDSPKNVRVYFVLRNKEQGGYFLRLVEIENRNTMKTVKKMFSEFLKAHIVEESGLKIRSLSSAEESVDAVYRYDYIDKPEELNEFWKFPLEYAEDYLAEIGELSKNKHLTLEDNLSNLAGYIICMDIIGKRLLMYKKHYPIAVIKKSAMVCGFKVRQKNTKMSTMYQVAEDTDLLQLNGTVHMIRLNNEVFVLDPRVFDQMAGVLEIIKNRANEVVKKVKDMEILENMELFASLDNPRYARKLARIRKNSAVFHLLDSEKLDPAAIVEFAKKEPYKARFQFSKDGKKIKLNNKKSVDAFLDLLNDSYLHSELTGEHYTSVAKDKIPEAAG